MDSKQAEKIAKRYGVPTQGQYVRLPSVEVLHAWLKQNNQKVVGWRGDYLAVIPIVSPHEELVVEQRTDDAT